MIPSDRPLRLMVVDDHPIVRTALVAMLERNPRFQVVAEAGDGAEALKLWEQHQPDVTLLDLRIPVLDGAQVVAQVRARHPKGRFIILTMYDREEDVHLALQAGAQGYMLKGMTSAELLAAIETVHAGGRVIPEVIAARLTARDGAPELTGQELRILRLIARGLSNADIAAELDISVGTVKQHVNRVLGKLGVKARTEAAYLAVQRGLVTLD